MGITVFNPAEGTALSLCYQLPLYISSSNNQQKFAVFQDS